MTASQMKRIRSKLAKAQQLTREAYELADKGHATDSLRYITAKASSAMDVTAVELEAMDKRDRQHAEAIVRKLGVSR